MLTTHAYSQPIRRCVQSLVLGWVLFAPLLHAAPQFVREPELIDRVVELMDRRLTLMPEVAAIKFRQQKPIADPAREREVIEQSVADARAMHLDAAAARSFFSVQILMARAVQEHLFERWRAGTEQPPEARDLIKVLRPELDALGRELLPAVYLASSVMADTPAAALQARVSRLIRHPGTTDGLIVELTRALLGLRITDAPTWATLRRVGTLRVGTTGDYAPFSDDRGGSLQGLDIELAQSLAQAWDVSVVFVRTSWPTLIDDLRKRKFDLAASGISINPERRQHADFSVPYYFDGKTPIARHENVSRFSSLDQIDQPGVRVVVNPGGTNERFVREHLKRATIVMHPDNRTIFDEIVARRADVMITDGIEVQLQERRHMDLKSTMPKPFTRAGKAVLLPSNSELTARVDGWLTEKVESGQIAEQLAQALQRSGR